MIAFWCLTSATSQVTGKPSCLARRTKSSPNYIIGSDTLSDTPVAPEFIGTSAFSLVSTTGADFMVNTTPNMSGEVHLEGQSIPLAQYVQQRGASFSLGDRGRAKIDEVAEKEFAGLGKANIKSNVDFYSGSVYSMMGIPTDLMTPVFAISRVVGWCAHIIEEKFAEAQGKPALYRPAAEYVGDYCGPIGCTFEPLEERKAASV